MAIPLPPTSSTREFVEYSVRLLARSPDEVQVEETMDGDTIIYKLRLAPDDVGRIIGREGRVIRAIRSLLRASAMRQGVRIALEIE